MKTFARLDRLPPYVFATVNEIKMEARRAGEDIIDLGMGNPDIGTPDHIWTNSWRLPENRTIIGIPPPWGFESFAWPSPTGTGVDSM